MTGYKLRDCTATSRVVATCCQSAMLLRFDDARHWVSMVRARFEGPMPPLAMRVRVRGDAKDGATPSNLPTYAGFPLPFLAKLLGARLAMLFAR